MTKSLITVVFAFSLLFVGRASAASIGDTFYFSTTPNGTGAWSLSLATPNLPVAAIGITTVDSAIFTINPLNVAIAPFGGGSSFTQAATPGRFSLNLNPAVCAGINCTPFATNGTVLLGTFQFPGGNPFLSMVLPDDDSVGGTIFDAQLNPYNVSCSSFDLTLSCVVVPEPAPLALLALAALAVRLTRRE